MTKKDSATDLKNGIILFTVGAIHRIFEVLRDVLAKRFQNNPVRIQRFSLLACVVVATDDNLSLIFLCILHVL